MDAVNAYVQLQNHLKAKDYQAAFHALWLVVAPVMLLVSEHIPNSGMHGIRLPFEKAGTYYLTLTGEILYVFPDGDRTKFTFDEVIDRISVTEFFTIAISAIEEKLKEKVNAYARQIEEMRIRNTLLHTSKAWLLPDLSTQT